MARDYYEILGVLPSAEDIVIRAAYKALAQRYHPDKWQGDAQEASRRMTELNEAYGVLSDTRQRATYDAQRRKAPSMAPEGGKRSRTPTPTPPSPPLRKTGFNSFMAEVMWTTEKDFRAWHPLRKLFAVAWTMFIFLFVVGMAYKLIKLAAKHVGLLP